MRRYLADEAELKAGGWRDWLVVGMLCLLALALRLLHSIDYAEELDSIRFLLAVDRFDIGDYRPHFPGYPVFVALGKVFNAFIADATRSLAYLCALCGALLVFPVYLVARVLWGRQAGLIASVLVVVNPMLWLYSEKLLSDTPGLLFLFSAFACFFVGVVRERRWLILSGCLLIGLTLGVRLSYFPFVFTLLGLSLWARQGVFAASIAVFLGVLLWLVPMVLASDWTTLVARGAVQGAGHFATWGGSVATVPDLGLRFAMLGWELLALGLNTWWNDRPLIFIVPTLALLICFSIYVLRGFRAEVLGRIWLWTLLALPYGLWIFFAQNITVKPRHALPLVVLALLAVASALARAINVGPRWLARLGVGCAAIWLVGQLASGYAIAHEHAATPSNAVRLARDIGRECSSPTPDAPASSRPQVVVYTATMKRHLELSAACAEVVVAYRYSQVKRDLQRRGVGFLAFVVSDVDRLERARRAPYRVYRRSRYIQNARRELALYREDKR
jgi:4-amino-4-deoxy-L-arabinose transferase-like glycosyltransferase